MHYPDSRSALDAISTAGIPANIDVSSADYTAPAGKRIKNVHVGTQGDLEIVDLDGTTRTISGWVGWLDCGVRSVKTANTTAGSITVILTTG